MEGSIYVKRLVIIFALLQLSTSAAADVLFDVISFSGTGAGQTASGTSNDVSWDLSPTFISNSNPPVIDGTYTRFLDSAFFTPALNDADAIHITGTDFTLTFDTPIKSILFYMSDDAGTANLDLGIAPTLISGSVGIVGTQASPSLSGGIVLYDNLSTTTLTHTANVFDGLDLAWVATPVPAQQGNPVPLPASFWLLMAGLTGMGLMRRRPSPTTGLATEAQF